MDEEWNDIDDYFAYKFMKEHQDDFENAPGCFPFILGCIFWLTVIYYIGKLFGL